MSCYQEIKHNKINCPICLEDIEKNDSIIASCNHGWCKDCNKLIENNTCPLCRSKIIGKTIFGHWDLKKNRFVSLEESIIKEIEEAEKKLNTKNYKLKKEKERNEFLTDIMINVQIGYNI